MKIISNMNCLSLVKKLTSCSRQDIIARDATNNNPYNLELYNPSNNAPLQQAPL
jgi:hypothetical protein